MSAADVYSSIVAGLAGAVIVITIAELVRLVRRRGERRRRAAALQDLAESGSKVAARLLAEERDR